MASRLTRNKEKALARILDQHRAQGSLSLLEAKGFLFMLVCSPDLVPPSQWIPRIIGAEVEFDSEEEAQTAMQGLMTLYNQINDMTFSRKPRLPSECRIAPSTMANFRPESNLYRWSAGVNRAREWLQDGWQDSLAEDDFKGFVIFARDPLCAEQERVPGNTRD